EPVSTQVAFFDDNGPKGGPGIRGALTVRLPYRPAVRGEQTAEGPRLAFDAGLRPPGGRAGTRLIFARITRRTRLASPSPAASPFASVNSSVIVSGSARVGVTPRSTSPPGKPSPGRRHHPRSAGGGPSDGLREALPREADRRVQAAADGCARGPLSHHWSDRRGTGRPDGAGARRSAGACGLHIGRDPPFETAGAREARAGRDRRRAGEAGGRHLRTLRALPGSYSAGACARHARGTLLPRLPGRRGAASPES